MNKNRNTETTKGLFGKDFILIVIGQIISLFGNAILRFALPLYILNESGSAALFGIVSAISFLPMVIMYPIGGIVADRVNKQRIMVVLDFFTTALILAFILASGQISIIPLIVVALMALSGIQGAYSPAVQASMPLLAEGENLVRANAVVNLVQSISGLLGPIIGGMLYAAYGLYPILAVSTICFFLAAVMELFIRIPHKKLEGSRSIWAIVKGDMSQSFHFILKEKPVLARATILVFCFNLFLSSMIVIGLPVLITQYLGMGNSLYGAAQGAMAAGGLVGGLIAGVFSSKLDIRKSYLLLLFCAVGLFPIVFSLMFGAPAFVSYIIITAICFIMMIFASIFSIQMLSFAQAMTPAALTGKVISYIMALSICAQPIGQALYGVVFEYFSGSPWAVILGAAVVALAIALFSKKTFQTM